MYAVVGTLLTALTILGFVYMVRTVRQPHPPRWTEHTLTHEVASIGIVALGGFGIAYLVQAVMLFREQPLTAMHALLIVLILAVFTAAWMLLKVRTRPAQHAQPQTGRMPDDAAASPRLGTPENPNSPPQPRTPRRPKKAA